MIPEECLGLLLVQQTPKSSLLEYFVRETPGLPLENWLTLVFNFSDAIQYCGPQTTQHVEKVLLGKLEAVNICE